MKDHETVHEHGPQQPTPFDDLEPEGFDQVDQIDDWSSLADQYTHTGVAVDELLRRLAGAAQMPDGQQLAALSDLGVADMALARSVWPSIPVDRRRQVLQVLIGQAAEDLTLQLGRLLRIALDDSDAAVRVLAIQGLWEDDDPSLIGPLIALLQRDPAVEVRAAAAAALGAFVLAGELGELEGALAMRAEEALLAVLHDEQQPLEVLCPALESIAYSGEVGVRQLIEEAYYTAQEELRLSAVAAMGRSADVRWRGLAQAELRSTSAAMRAQAANACAELEAQAALRDLVELLIEDSDRAVRLACIHALGRIGGRDAREALASVAEGDDADEAAAADVALEEMAFYADGGGVPLFDESQEELDGWDVDTWDEADDEAYAAYGDEDDEGDVR